MSSGDLSTRPGWPAARHVALLLVVCLLVYWPRLGATGFTSTEGHRVIPGWTMLDEGGWFLPRLFGQVYLRKPPGMSWAVALSGAVLGQTEFSARAVSALAATGMALLALVMGCWWFGRRAGVTSGLATALTPFFWGPGRSAEIEALNNAATMAAVVLLLEVLIPPAGRKRGTALGLAALAGVAIAVATAAKGPAGFAAIGCAMVAGWGTPLRGVPKGPRDEDTSWKGVPRPVWLSLLVSGGLVAAGAAMISRAVHFAGFEPVTQSVGDFLWSRAKLTPLGIARVVSMPAAALALALPASLGLVFPWGPDAKAEATDVDSTRALALARALAAACLGSLVVLTLLGIDNPRYAMPSISFVPVLAGYVARGWAGAFGPLRQRIAAWAFLRHPAAWPALLLIGAAAFLAVVEPGQRSKSGRDAGAALAESLPDGSQVWADLMVEARPEVMLYARRAAAARGRTVSFVWVPKMSAGLFLPRPPNYLLLRSDAESGEVAAYETAGFMDRLRPVASGTVHKYVFTLYQMSQPQHAPGP